MGNTPRKNTGHDPRSTDPNNGTSRIDNLTDAVFGIAITLLIFNLVNPNSFTDLLTFTKTLPAFLISISFLMLFWYEHNRFSRMYDMNKTPFIVLNVLFIALIIFYVYPLRFLTLYLTTIFFDAELGLSIENYQAPLLMIYYGAAAFALYFTLFLFYRKAYKMKVELRLTTDEAHYTKSQKQKLIIMFLVPLLSVVVTIIVNSVSDGLAAALGGFTYGLYVPAIMFWKRKFRGHTGKKPA